LNEAMALSNVRPSIELGFEFGIEFGGD